MAEQALSSQSRILLRVCFGNRDFDVVGVSDKGGA